MRRAPFIIICLQLAVLIMCQDSLRTVIVPHIAVKTDSVQKVVGGIDASSTNGRTTWNLGAKHTSDFKNGITEIRGEIEKK
ncbi:hypothetical protein PRIPAC_91788 [Pristionchus pacificus]|uniref:Uncharacterized protein n=1 Tax=Pristionchus pacificus TaxID=54126 RepID=A0A2A6CI92_PRIPA|nr:hypothetical protein PRIPAC_91788 [Pristionchus pacificus]|eukprot:PDM77922.1 hypothetical protein PRIPAC_34789 [Pristionchus pacificus]